jgi:hypothetical protein
MNQRTMVQPPPPPQGPAGKRSFRGIAAGAVVGVIAVVAVIALWPGSAASEPPAPPPPTSDAQPYAQSGFAGGLTGKTYAPLATPETFSHGPTVDGCDRGYGVHGECVPWNFPPGVGKDTAAKCGWLKQQGARALEVPGEDRHKLVPAGGPKAPDGNPYACPKELGTA